MSIDAYCEQTGSTSDVCTDDDLEFITCGNQNTELLDRFLECLAQRITPQVATFAEHLAGAVNGAQAILFYGSNLRTGSLDGILDFYILCEGERERGIWPRVSYHERKIGDTVLRAKVATMTLTTFRAAAGGEMIDTTIWARYVQPSALAWQRDDDSAVATARAVAAAAITAARLAVALGPTQAMAGQYWRCLFRATYAAEFRMEQVGREETILSANREHFSGLLPMALRAAGIEFEAISQHIHPSLSTVDRARILRWWGLRRRMGKILNLVRLLKASTTFEGAARYAAWKIERHTGVAVALSAWQERHPVLAAPGVLWRVWREQRRGDSKQVRSLAS